MDLDGAFLCFFTFVSTEGSLDFESFDAEGFDLLFFLLGFDGLLYNPTVCVSSEGSDLSTDRSFSFELCFWFF